MSLIQMIAIVRSNLSRFQSKYDEGRALHPELAPFATPEEVAVALDAASPLRPEERFAIIAALTAERHRSPHGLWDALFLVAFAPLLLRMRKRFGRPGDPDRDQRVILAFLEATRSKSLVRAAGYSAVALRRATEKALRVERERELAEPELVSFDEDAHSPCNPFSITAAELRAEAAWAGRRTERARAWDHANVRSLEARREPVREAAAPRVSSFASP
jgi:hypothetical protein